MPAFHGTGVQAGESSSGPEERFHYLDLIHGHKCGNPVTGVQVDPDRMLFELVSEASSRDEQAAQNARVSEALESRGMGDDAAKLRACGAWAVLRSWAVSGVMECRAANFCSFRSCRCCARVKAARAADVYSVKVCELIRREPGLLPRMVTITQPAARTFADGLRGMTGILQRLRHKRRDARRGKSSSEWASFSHLAWSVEAKRGEGGKSWHVHCHGVGLGASRLDLDRLHDEYRTLSGASHRPDVRLLASGRMLLRLPEMTDRVAELVRADCSEVFKYSMKFNDMDPASVAEFHECSRGKRLRFGWDGFRGCKVPDEMADSAELVGEWLEGFFVRAAGRSKLKRLRSGTELNEGPWVDVV